VYLALAARPHDMEDLRQLWPPRSPGVAATETGDIIKNYALAYSRNRPPSSNTSYTRSTPHEYLGINAFHGDASVALVRDGALVGAIAEVRRSVRDDCAGGSR
jgi:hypothetical protein